MVTELEFRDVSYISENRIILKNITVSINQGDFISVIGPSGSGKSTFLKLCCHLISPAKGEIIYNGINIMQYNPTDLRKSIAYCFQTPHLFGDVVMDNIVFPYKIRNAKIDLKRVYKLLAEFNLNEEFLSKKVKNLSGGEKQRLALIRTLLFKPEILLLDEVTSALDVDNTLTVEKIINILNQEGTTVIWITHNMEQSKKYSNKVLTIENGEIKDLEELR